MRRRRTRAPRAARGFTLIELLVVVALIALGAAVTSLALRDPATTRLEREAERLVALLEAARAESRASGVAARWEPRDDGFRFAGLPEQLGLPGGWLGDGVSAEVVGARAVPLGPEPVIGAQRIVLRLDGRSAVVETDGLAPFAVVEAGAESAR